ncbi:MAG: ribosome silencing factor [Candidatus Gastranaerophilales bacterium]|nr:ribosome silencing factor [Candidatus Gastranaerophilales bacterium]
MACNVAVSGDFNLEEITSYKLASVVARLIDDKKGKDISILNISNVSVLADYFVICSADTTTQVKALTNSVHDGVKKFFGRLPIGEENDLKHRWNLVDYGDVIVHVLHKEERDTYAIEKFWNHALRVEEADWMEESKEYSAYNEM